jgi:UPF0716 protein FxsA
LRKLLFLFIAVPVIELYLLIKIGQILGPLPTILLVVFTGIAGWTLTKNQGLQVLSAIRNDLQEGRIPGDKLVSGLIIIVGGAFLLTPGLITDIAGFLLLLPPSHRAVQRWLIQKIKEGIETGRIRMFIR